MGSGGNSDYETRIIDRLQKVAQESFKSAQPEKRNVFISFDYNDIAEVNFLRGQAKNESTNLEFSDYSLKEPFNSERSEYIKSGIRERIRQSSVTLIYLSDTTHKSQWVDWEARESKVMGKGVICVHKGDNPPRNMPSFVQELNLKVVRWNHKELSDAIEASSLNR
jgi:hypothetical protein